MKPVELMKYTLTNHSKSDHLSKKENFDSWFESLRSRKLF